MEKWMKLNDKYEISNFGRVHKLKTGKIYRPRAKIGTLQKLWVKKKIRYLHRIVAELFIPNPRNHKFVRHIDNSQEGKLNNSVENLAWGSATINALLRNNSLNVDEDGKFYPVLTIKGEKFAFPSFEDRLSALKLGAHVRHILSKTM